MSKVKHHIPAMRHLNDDILGSISITTTGKDPKKHDLLQVAIVIGDEYLNLFNISPFYITMKPRFLETLETNRDLADQAMLTGMDYYEGAYALDLWFKGLQLPRAKKIQPLGHFVDWQLQFIREWLGPTATDMYFDWRSRDTGIAARFLNDRACMVREQYPVSKYGLSYMCNSLGVSNEMKKDALHNAIATLELYRRLVAIRL